MGWSAGLFGFLNEDWSATFIRRLLWACLRGNSSPDLLSHVRWINTWGSLHTFNLSDTSSWKKYDRKADCDFSMIHTGEGPQMNYSAHWVSGLLKRPLWLWMCSTMNCPCAACLWLLHMGEYRFVGNTVFLSETGMIIETDLKRVTYWKPKTCWIVNTFT